ncbi:MAG: hypothetical protein N2376_14080 [Clostridia bacterium]|nr:hypothetical protein [Clostridia bacterium]
MGFLFTWCQNLFTESLTGFDDVQGHQVPAYRDAVELRMLGYKAFNLLFIPI